MTPDSPRSRVRGTTHCLGPFSSPWRLVLGLLHSCSCALPHRVPPPRASQFYMGDDDHIKHATDLFLDFKIVFSRVLMLLMGRHDD